VGNLRVAGGRRQLEARIDFPAPPVPAAEGAWRAARAETLVAACASGQGADR
jgi:hypothetical protein